MQKKKLWSMLKSKELSAEISSCACFHSLLTQLSAGGLFSMQQVQNFIWTLFFDTSLLTCYNVCGLCFNKLKPFQLLYREISCLNKIQAYALQLISILKMCCPTGFSVTALETPNLIIILSHQRQFQLGLVSQLVANELCSEFSLLFFSPSLF